MLNFHKKIVIDDNNNPIEVVFPINEFRNIEEVIEDYGLSRLIEEVVDDEVLSYEDAISYYHAIISDNVES